MTDARLEVGANGGPPLDDIEGIDYRSLQIAARGLEVICAAWGRNDAWLCKVKKAGGEHMDIRNTWLWAMSPHLSRKDLATIAKLNEKTVTTIRKQVDDHAERNGLLRGFYDMIADMVEPLPGIVDDGNEALADMAVERALDRVRKSVDALGR